EAADRLRDALSRVGPSGRDGAAAQPARGSADCGAREPPGPAPLHADGRRRHRHRGGPEGGLRWANPPAASQVGARVTRLLLWVAGAAVRTWTYLYTCG